jgi:hypothetical protein
LVKMTIRISIDRLKRHFRENLGAPLIIFFDVMLLICTFLLVQGYLDLADQVAVYALYSLVVGVALQLVSFLRHQEKTSE